MNTYYITTDAEQTEVLTRPARDIETAIEIGKSHFAYQADGGNIVNLIIRDSNEKEIYRKPL